MALLDEHFLDGSNEVAFANTSSSVTNSSNWSNYAASVVGKHLVNGYPLICTGTGQCSLILCVCHGSFSQLLPGQAFI